MEVKRAASRLGRWLKVFIFATLMAAIIGLAFTKPVLLPESAFDGPEHLMWTDLALVIGMVPVAILSGLIVASVPSWRVGAGISIGLGAAFCLWTMAQDERNHILLPLACAGAGAGAALIGFLMKRKPQSG